MRASVLKKDWNFNSALSCMQEPCHQDESAPVGGLREELRGVGLGWVVAGVQGALIAGEAGDQHSPAG